MSSVRLINLQRLTSFTQDGEVRELKDPDALASYRQLARLNRLGRLVVVAEPVTPLTRGTAAWAIAHLRDEEDAPLPAPRPRYRAGGWR